MSEGTAYFSLGLERMEDELYPDEVEHRVSDELAMTGLSGT